MSIDVIGMMHIIQITSMGMDYMSTKAADHIIRDRIAIEMFKENVLRYVAESTIDEYFGLEFGQVMMSVNGKAITGSMPCYNFGPGSKVTDHTLEKINDDATALCRGYLEKWDGFKGTEEYEYLDDKMKNIRQEVNLMMG